MAAALIGGAGSEVARVLEGIIQLASQQAPVPRTVTGPRDAAMRLARTCYDHIAGRLGVAITQHLLDEKISKRLYGRGGPDSGALRAGKANIHVHLHYISWLIDRRNWLAGEHFSPLDAYALTLTRWGTIAGITPADHPELWAFVQKVAAVPAVARVIERERLQLDMSKPAA